MINRSDPVTEKFRKRPYNLQRRNSLALLGYSPASGLFSANSCATTRYEVKRSTFFGPLRWEELAQKWYSRVTQIVGFDPGPADRSRIATRVPHTPHCLRCPLNVHPN